jgi:hypothetical protein
MGSRRHGTLSQEIRWLLDGATAALPASRILALLWGGRGLVCSRAEVDVALGKLVDGGRVVRVPVKPRGTGYRIVRRNAA